MVVEWQHVLPSTAMGVVGAGSLNYLIYNALDCIPRVYGEWNQSIAEFSLLDIFHLLSSSEKREWFFQQCSRIRVPWQYGKVPILLHRTVLFPESIPLILSMTEESLRREWQIVFEGERGVDAGGLLREWFQLVTEAIMHPDHLLFEFCRSSSSSGGTGNSRRNMDSGSLQTDSSAAAVEGFYFPRYDGAAPAPAHPEGMAHEESEEEVEHGRGRSAPLRLQPRHPRAHLIRYYRFYGRIMGRSLLDHCSLPVSFHPYVYRFILGEDDLAVTEEDLKLYDSELYQGLCVQLRQAAIVGDVAALLADFAEEDGAADSGALVGATTPSVESFIQRRVEWIMRDRIRFALESLRDGVYDVIPRGILSALRSEELAGLLNGSTALNVDDWKKHTEYKGGYDAYSPTVCYFWTLIESMDQAMRQRVLQFVTGSSRLPVEGFRGLESQRGRTQRFTIERIPRHLSVLPRAHTCFNRLDLPEYSSYAEFSKFMTMALEAETVGFTMD